jgi:hypothetical protein
MCTGWNVRTNLRAWRRQGNYTRKRVSSWSPAVYTQVIPCPVLLFFLETARFQVLERLVDLHRRIEPLHRLHISMSWSIETQNVWILPPAGNLWSSSPLTKLQTQMWSFTLDVVRIVENVNFITLEYSWCLTFMNSVYCENVNGSSSECKSLLLSMS